jgi:hypothetical protein
MGAVAALIALLGPGVSRALSWGAGILAALTAVWAVLRRERGKGAAEERERRDDEVRDAVSRADREVVRLRAGDATRRLRDGKF